MMQNIYAIKDIKAADFIQTFSHQSDLTAKRELSVVVNDKEGKSLLSKFPEDYQLFSIGTFETESGILTPKLDFVCNLDDLIN